MVSYGFLRDHKTYYLLDFKVGKFGLCPLGLCVTDLLLSACLTLFHCQSEAKLRALLTICIPILL